MHFQYSMMKLQGNVEAGFRNNMIERKKELDEVKKLIESFPVTALLGARQVGKTTLARQLTADHYFDLENPRDLVRLETPQLTLEDLQGLIVIDEVQRKPELFPLLRYLVDHNPRQKYLLLGSASQNLFKQTSETLAGRIAFHMLGGFTINEIGKNNWKKLWIRGGFPPSFLAVDSAKSVLWRENFVTTFLERDIPQLGLSIPARTLRRFWTLISHYNAQIINYSEISRSFGMSDMTIRRYLDILSGTFMIRVLQPWFANLRKRLVKRPKIYFRDSGLVHTLLSIESLDQLMSHPKLGASWEGFALEQVCRSIGKRDEQFYFWHTGGGAELDLFWRESGNNWGAEFKFQDAPRLTKSMKIALSDLNLARLWVIYPGKERYKLAKNVTVLPLTEIQPVWRYEG